MSNVVLYCEKLPTEGMETLISELCPKELDLRFLYPVTVSYTHLTLSTKA